MFAEILFISRSTDPNGFYFIAQTEEFNPSYIVIIKIGFNFYVADYDDDTGNYSYLVDSKSPFINVLASEQYMFILYDHNKEIIVDNRQGEIVLETISTLELLFLSSGITPDNREWTSGARVEAVDGPYQNDELVNQIDLTLPVVYYATPNQKDLAPELILSMKWEYQYNDGSYNKFKNSKRSVETINGVVKCKLECWFHNDPKIQTVQIFPFFRSRGTKVFLSTPVKGYAPSKGCRITLEEIELVFEVYTNDKEFRQEIIDYLNKYIYDSQLDIHIDTPLRKAHFFAQIGTETGLSKTWLVETDVKAYSVQNVLDNFGERAKYLKSQGLLEEYCKERPQKKLLNHLYCNLYPATANGNGSEASGDGYTYRGRGLIQLTGRANYRKASLYINSVFPDENVDFEKNPDKVKEAKYAVLSAISFWEANEVWKTADELPTLTDEGARKIRKKVNGHTTQYKKAWGYFDKGIKVFEKNCVEKPSVNDSLIGAKKKGTYNAQGIVTFHVYYDGTIEKHIPKEVKSEFKNKYKYVYHDKNGQEHEIYSADWFDVDKRKNGKTGEIVSGYTNTYTYPSGGDARKAYVYKNGDIVVEGTETATAKYGIKLYPLDAGTVELIKMADQLKYEKSGVNIFYSFKNSQRRYCNPIAYAGFIGALAELNRKDVLCTGMCFEDSTSYPSVTHPNGDSADTAYFATVKEEQLKVNAFKKFHFTKIYKGTSSTWTKLTGATAASGHNDHLHAGEFDINKLTIVNEE